MQVKDAALLTGIKYPRATAIYRAYKSQLSIVAASSAEENKLTENPTNDRDKICGSLFWKLFDDSAVMKE